MRWWRRGSALTRDRELMKDPFRSIDDLQHAIGAMAVEITQAHFVGFSVPKGWRPSVNAFRCDRQFIVCMELAGVEKSAIEVRAEPRRLVVRGRRPIPEPDCVQSPAVQVLALEIDHGRFERVIEFPADIDADHVTAEHRAGLLWINLPLRSSA